jgi:hypothetical protein
VDPDRAMNPVRFSVVPGRWAIARVSPDAPMPMWAFAADGFVSITRTADELSVVCPESVVPRGVQVEPGWALLKLLGPFPFDEVGVLASVASPLAAAGISLFALSTFDTDYVLVKEARLPSASEALVFAGHELIP